MSRLDIARALAQKESATSPASEGAAVELVGSVQLGEAVTTDDGVVGVLLDGSDPDDADAVVECQTDEAIQVGDRITVVSSDGIYKAIALTPESTGVAAAAQAAADAAIAADEASKVATDFLTMDEESGLTIGASSLDRSVNINAGGVDIIDGSEVLAHYGSYTFVGTNGVGGVRIVGGTMPDLSDWDGTLSNPFAAIRHIKRGDIRYLWNVSGATVAAKLYGGSSDNLEISDGAGGFASGDVALLLIIDDTNRFLKSPLVFPIQSRNTFSELLYTGKNWYVDTVSMELSLYERPTDTSPASPPLMTNGYFYNPASVDIQGNLEAASISAPVATANDLGVVKVDGTTITAASDGTISAAGGSTYKVKTFIPSSGASTGTCSTSASRIFYLTNAYGEATADVDSNEGQGTYTINEAGIYRITLQCGMYPNTTAKTRLCCGIYDGTGVSGTRLALGVQAVTNMTANTASQMVTILCEYVGRFAAGANVSIGVWADVTAAKILRTNTTPDITYVRFERLA